MRKMQISILSFLLSILLIVPAYSGHTPELSCSREGNKLLIHVEGYHYNDIADITINGNSVINILDIMSRDSITYYDSSIEIDSSISVESGIQDITPDFSEIKEQSSIFDAMLDIQNLESDLNEIDDMNGKIVLGIVLKDGATMYLLVNINIPLTHGIDAYPIKANASSYGTILGHYNNIVNVSNYKTSYYYIDFLGYEWQCAEYVNRYYYEVYGYSSWKGSGNAKDYYTNIPLKNSDIKAYENGGSTAPQAGDIIVWDYSSDNKYGHVAIVREVGSDYIKVIQQNWGNSPGDSSYKFSMTVSGGQYTVSKPSRGAGSVKGWLRTSRTSNTVYIIDSNTSANDMVWGSGNTSLSASSSGYSSISKKGYLTGLYYAKANAGVTWEWKFKAPQTMQVDVYAFIPSKYATAKANYYIYDSNNVQLASTEVDQNSLYDVWTKIGSSVSLTSDAWYSVKVHSSSSERSKYIAFDAIKLIK